MQVGDPNAFLHYWVLRVAFSGATACVAHVDGSDLYGEHIYKHTCVCQCITLFV